jgi:hypothetical protein
MYGASPYATQPYASLGRGDRTLYAAIVANENTFGTPTLVVILTPSTVENANSFGSPFVAGLLQPSTVVNLNGFGDTDTIDAELYASRVVNASMFYEHIIWSPDRKPSFIARRDQPRTFIVTRHQPSFIVRSEARPRTVRPSTR